MSELNYNPQNRLAPLGCGPLLSDAGQPDPISMKQQVFEYVRAHGQAARADISHELAISAGSATTLTADLIANGFLREIAGTSRDTGRGRPKVALEVVKEAAFVIGMKLAFKTHTAVLVDLAGNVVGDASLPSGEGRRSFSQLLAEIASLIDLLLTSCALDRNEISGIGIGMPGVVDHAKGNIVWSPLLITSDHDLSSAVSEHNGIPVLIDNDSNVLTLAELWFGEGRGLSDFAVVTVESGVGMGLVSGSELYRGAHGLGLELGHTKVQLDGALCQCGQRGCLEAYLADYALIREAATALGQGFEIGKKPEEILAALFDRAKSGHKEAETIFRRAGQYLSLGLSNVVHLFDPDLIILSGERMQYQYLFAEDVLQTMERLMHIEGRNPCRVAFNAWDDLVWARGAAALALSSITADLIDTVRAA